MKDIDIEKLLVEVSVEAPCGSGRLIELNDLRRSVRAKEPPPTASNQAKAEPPAWPKVLEKAVELLSKSKDIEIAGILCLALMKVDGFNGLGKGLALIRRLLERYWSCIYPEIDSEEGLRFRNTALEYALAHRQTSPDEETLLDAFDKQLIIKSPIFGEFCLNDIDLVKGKVSEGDSDQQKSKLSDLQGAFKKASEEEIQTSLQGFTGFLSELDGIKQLYRDKGESDASLDLRPLRRRLKHAISMVTELAGIEKENVEGADVVDTDETGVKGELTNAPIKDTIGAINNRSDVVAVIDKLCDYYEQNEPSSPVPMLLERAKQLVAMNFIDIVSDLVPNGMSDAEVFRGQNSDKKK